MSRSYGVVAVQRLHGFVVEDADLLDRGDDGRQFTEMRVCPKNCVNGYVRISRLEPVCQIVWQTDICYKRFLLEVKL